MRRNPYLRSQISAISDLRSLLQIAGHGNVEEVAELLQKKADPNITGADTNGFRTALHEACLWCDNDNGCAVVRLLLKHMADPARRETTFEAFEACRNISVLVFLQRQSNIGNSSFLGAQGQYKTVETSPRHGTCHQGSLPT